MADDIALGQTGRDWSIGAPAKQSAFMTKMDKIVTDLKIIDGMAARAYLNTANSFLTMAREHAKRMGPGWGIKVAAAAAGPAGLLALWLRNKTMGGVQESIEQRIASVQGYVDKVKGIVANFGDKQALPQKVARQVALSMSQSEIVLKDADAAANEKTTFFADWWAAVKMILTTVRDVVLKQIVKPALDTAKPVLWPIALGLVGLGALVIGLRFSGGGSQRVVVARE